MYPGAMSKRAGCLNKSYPVPLVLALCAVAFLVGRYTTPFSRLPSLETKTAPDGGGGSIGHQFKPQESLIEGLERGADHKSGWAPDFLSTKELPSPAKPGDSGNDFYTMVPYQILSWYPRTILFPNFIDKERCKKVIELARRRMSPSTVARRVGETIQGTKQVRTSTGTFLDSEDDKSGVLKWLEDKISHVTMIPVGHGESFNVLRYDVSQKYDAHYDVFDPTSYGPQESARVATVLTYLSNVEEGGETVLPLEGMTGIQRLKDGFDYKDCTMGLTYKPRMGDALLFYSTFVNGTIEQRSLHGGCPVVSGEKWVATKWLRDKCFTEPCN